MHRADDEEHVVIVLEHFAHLDFPVLVSSKDERFRELRIVIEILVEALLEPGFVAVTPGVEHRPDHRVDVTGFLDGLQQHFLLQLGRQRIEHAELAVEASRARNSPCPLFRRGLDDLLDAVLDVEAVRLQGHQRHSEAGEPGLEHGERLNVDARCLRAFAHAVGVGTEQVEEAPAFRIDRTGERDGGLLRIAFCVRIYFQADALRFIERLGQRAADREAAFRKEMHGSEQVNRVVAALHFPQGRLRAGTGRSEDRESGEDSGKQSPPVRVIASASTHSMPVSMPPSSSSASQR